MNNQIKAAGASASSLQSYITYMGVDYLHTVFRFLCKKYQCSSNRKPPEIIGQLFVGGRDEPFAVMKVDTFLHKLDNKIIECRLAVMTLAVGFS
jgi:hypothetical protein